MKELSVEQKAKCYDEALKVLHKYDGANIMFSQSLKEEMFPELKESEDERIRKSLTILLQHFCKGYRVPGLDFPVSYKDMLTWLEKQGKKEIKRNNGEIPNSAWSEEDEEEANYIADFIENLIKKEKLVSKKTMVMEEMVAWLRDIKYRYLPKPEQGWSEEDERIRKWLISTLKSLNSSPVQIDDACEMMLPAIAWLEKQCEPTEINPSEFDSQLNRLLKQFESLPKEELASSLSFYLNVVQNSTYKEKKQGEQKYNWSEEDTQYINDTLALLSFGCSIHSVGEVQEWLQSLNNRVQLKPKWSEEDLYKIENALFGTYAADVATKLLNKIKSSYWKPSDEQMDALRYVTNFDYGGYKATLVSLYEQLKKL